MLEDEGPRFVKELGTKVTFLNDTGVTLDCVAEGNPSPSVAWTTGSGIPVSGSPNLMIPLGNGSLVFYPFGPASYRPDVHDAVYRCLASNRAGAILSPEVNVKAGKTRLRSMLSTVFHYAKINTRSQCSTKLVNGSKEIGVPSFPFIVRSSSYSVIIQGEP